MIDYEQDKPAADLNDDDKLQRFITWFKLVNDSEAEQRQNEAEDLAFQDAKNQWTPEAQKARKGRPMLSISLLKQPLQLVRSQAAGSVPSVVSMASSFPSATQVSTPHVIHVSCSPFRLRVLSEYVGVLQSRLRSFSQPSRCTIVRRVGCTDFRQRIAATVTVTGAVR